VAIPCNDNALITAVSTKSINLSKDMLKDLNIEEVKEPKEVFNNEQDAESASCSFAQVCDGTMLPVKVEATKEPQSINIVPKFVDVVIAPKYIKNLTEERLMKLGRII
jgi:hypothetical protein